MIFNRRSDRWKTSRRESRIGLLSYIHGLSRTSHFEGLLHPEMILKLSRRSQTEIAVFRIIYKNPKGVLVLFSIQHQLYLVFAKHHLTFSSFSAYFLHNENRKTNLARVNEIFCEFQTSAEKMNNGRNLLQNEMELKKNKKQSKSTVFLFSSSRGFLLD